MDGENAIHYIINNNIEGVIVECGVESGNFEYCWITKLLHFGEYRDIYMYDTFDGLTEPSEHDYTHEDSVIYKMNNKEVCDFWNKEKWCYCPLEKVKNRLNQTGYPEDKLKYIVGDVLDTLKDDNNIPDKIAILRLDTDWYQSSKYELERLYDKVTMGGLIIFDDYFHWNGQRKATDDFFKERGYDYNVTNLYNGKTGAIIKKYK